jgi:hypothetical protein
VRRDDRPEDFFAEQLVPGVVGLHKRRLDEVTLAVVVAAAGDDRRIPPGMVDVAADLVERAFVDDRAHEMPEVPDVAHLDVGHHRRRAVAHFVPH